MQALQAPFTYLVELLMEIDLIGVFEKGACVHILILIVITMKYHIYKMLTSQKKNNH